MKVEYINLAADDSNMAKVLKALVPKESINADVNSWLNDLYVVYLNNKPVAMTSPTTLLASAADYNSAFGGQIPRPWSTNGKFLTDPITQLQPQERDALNFWLAKLQDKIQNLKIVTDATPAEIANNLSIEEDEDNIYVYFDFPLSGNGGAKYRFCKIYSRRDLIYIQNDVPVIEMWPNIQK